MTWKTIEEIVAPGREARIASYKRRREMTGNAFGGGADFVNVTTGAPSWSNAGEGAKQEDVLDFTMDDDNYAGFDVNGYPRNIERRA